MLSWPTICSAQHVLDFGVNLGPVIDSQAVAFFVGYETVLVLVAEMRLARSSPSSTHLSMPLIREVTHADGQAGDGSVMEAQVFQVVGDFGGLFLAVFWHRRQP